MNNVPVHIYECKECVLLFAVEQAFEDQSNICCPNCGNENIKDAAAGELVIKNKTRAATRIQRKTSYTSTIARIGG